MGFTRTSEGRVFFKNADNDDLQRAGNNDTTSDPVMPGDNTQMQILLLLKSLNTKLKSSKSDQSSFKKQLAGYKATIKNLEEKTSAHETNYIDLEQKVSRKQNEANVKSTRIESSVKKTLTQLDEARKLVQELEEKNKTRDGSLESLKETLLTQKNKDDEIHQAPKIVGSCTKRSKRENGEQRCRLCCFDQTR